VFGIGGSEILVILIIALLFLGPDKLPDAAKQISKGIRDLKKQSRALQQTIENDEHIGGAIRDLKSALRGEEIPVRPPVRKLPENTIAQPSPASPEGERDNGQPAPEPPAADAKPENGAAPAKHDVVTEPPHAGELDPEAPPPPSEELAGIIKPPPGSPVGRTPEGAPDRSIASAGEAGARETPEDVAKQKHG
jgi:sec-independent protein translocase protein TatB